MSKRWSRAQQIGAEGEAAFRRYGLRAGLLPNKVDEDVGIDFFCQVEGARGGNGSALIVPKVVGVNVRSTMAKRHPRIRLDRSDAEGLLQAEFPTFVALVHLDGRTETVYHRFVDEEFAVELADFLAGSHNWLYLSPRQCRGEGSFAGDLAGVLAGNAPERVKVALAERGLAEYVPEATVEVRRNRVGELTVVEVGNFYDLFLRSREPTQDSVYGAVFGAPGKRVERLARLGPRPELAETLMGLPTSTQFVGVTIDADSVLVAEGTEFGIARLAIKQVYTATYHGWVHKTGFSITMSRPVLRDGVNVHEIDASVDAEERVQLATSPELWEFLEACGIGSSVHREGNDRLVLSIDFIRDLRRFHAYAAWFRHASGLHGWEAIDEHLDLALDNESLQTLAWCAELAQDANLLLRFGFVVEGEEPREIGRKFELPVVGNFGDQSVVTWLSVDGLIFERDGCFCGLRIDAVTAVRVETRPRLEKSSMWPEIVVSGDWPTMLISSDGYAQTDTNATEWNLQIEME